MIAVFGATGHTGRFVVSELLGRGMTPIAVARNGRRLAELGFADCGVQLREASIDDPDSLIRAFQDAAAVVNCAGPFLDTADVVALAALQAGIHYLDVTAEQPSAQATYETFDGPARTAGVIVMPAMGFYGGFADLLVTAAIGDWESAGEIRIGIALDSWYPTHGTRMTGARNTALRMVISDGKLAPMVQPAAETVWEFPEPFARQSMTEVPFSEVIVIARHLRTCELHTYLCLTALRDIRDPATPPPRAADETGRSAQIFLVETIVKRGGRTRRVAAHGRDIYAFTASLVCEAAQRILDGEVRDSGAHAPGAVFDAGDFLTALAPRHLTFKVTEG